MIQVSGNEKPSLLIAFATKTFVGGQLVSKMHVIELGAQPGLCLLFLDSFNSGTILMKSGARKRLIKSPDCILNKNY